MSAVPLRLPDLGEGVEEGVVVALRVAPGDTVVAEQIVLEIETEKVTVEVPAPRAGVIHKLCVGIDDRVHPGDVVLELDAGPGTDQVEPEIAVDVDAVSETSAVLLPADPTARDAPQVAVAERHDIVPAGPGARREARELGVDIAAVAGSGPDGRISTQDVRRHVRNGVGVVASGGNSESTGLPLPDLARYGAVRREAATRIQRATATNLARAASIVPHAWVTRRIDVTALESSRRALRQAADADAAPLTLTAVLCKAVAVLLTEMPRFNASWDERTNEIVYREYVHVGVAVDTPAGLFVPVIREADHTSIAVIAERLYVLSASARASRLEPAAMGGAGITITNLGGLGVEVLQPIVNWPEAAIVGVGALEAYEQGGETRSRFAATLGFDHRLINGADAARFLARLDSLLSDPLALAVVA